MKIKKKKLLKMLKNVNRLLELELGHKHSSGFHKTSKKDAREKQKNTVRRDEID